MHLRKPTPNIADTGQKGTSCHLLPSERGKYGQEKLSCLDRSQQVAACPPAPLRNAGLAPEAPFHPGGPLQMSLAARGPPGCDCTHGRRWGCPQHPAEGYEPVFPGSCHSATELCMRSQSYAEDNRVVVGSRNFLLLPVSRSMLPGNRGWRQDFPPLMQNLLCEGRADPTPTPCASSR